MKNSTNHNLIYYYPQKTLQKLMSLMTSLLMYNMPSGTAEKYTTPQWQLS